MWGAIVAFFAAFGPLIKKVCELLVSLIELYVEYVKIRKQRLKDAVENELEAKKRAKEIEFAKANANVKAFFLIEKDAWKDRFNTVEKFIRNKDYDKVLALIQIIDREDINKFLFDEELDPMYRTLKIINIMQGVNNE